MVKTVNLIWWKLEPSLSYEYDWLNALLSDFKVNHIAASERNICYDNAIVVANLSQALFAEQNARQQYKEDLDQFCRYIRRFKAEGMKVGLFHLGDEFYKESTHFYQELDFVFRQYYKYEDHKKYSKCYHLPIGYKSGFRSELVHRSIDQREYLWSFAGHLKGSRYEMIRHAKDLPNGKCHTTTQWNDPNGLNTQEYASLLSNTKFSLCPMGNYSVDCFRVYESLEAGAIPIVESKGVREALGTLLNPQFILKYGSWDQRFWLRNYRYWEKTFDSDFPCPLIYSWKDLEATIHSIDLQSTFERVQVWWKNYKQSMHQLIRTTVEETFS